MMEAAEETKTTTTTSVTLNIGYPSSWQGVLKICKCIFLFCCLVCSGILVNWVHPFTNNYANYCLAISVLGFISELVIFILYVAGINKKWSANAVCSILMIIYHTIMLIMMFAACIIMTGYSGGEPGMAYNTFAILTVMGFSLDIYFNFIWIRGGPELAALAIPGQ